MYTSSHFNSHTARSQYSAQFPSFLSSWSYSFACRMCYVYICVNFKPYTYAAVVLFLSRCFAKIQRWSCKILRRVRFPFIYIFSSLFTSTDIYAHIINRKKSSDCDRFYTQGQEKKHINFPKTHNNFLESQFHHHHKKRMIVWWQEFTKHLRLYSSSSVCNVQKYNSLFYLPCIFELGKCHFFLSLLPAHPVRFMDKSWLFELIDRKSYIEKNCQFDLWKMNDYF